MRRTDLDSLQQAIDASSSWVQVAKKMGRAGGSGDRYKQVATNHNLKFSHLVSHMETVEKPEDEAYPVEEKGRLAHRRAAIGVAITWFLNHGFLPS